MAHIVTQLLFVHLLVQEIPELCNCTLNQLKFNLQQHPAVIICQRCCRNPSPLWSRAYVDRWLLCFYTWKRAFVGLLGLKNQIVQLKVALQSLPVAPCILESPADFISSVSSQAPAVQQCCSLQPAGTPKGGGSRVARAAWPRHLAPTLGLTFGLPSVLNKKAGFVCVCEQGCCGLSNTD